jgi:membrane protease YdiL (CAAX protease family)
MPEVEALISGGAISSFAQTFILGGPLFEEPGWRGFALPRLQSLRGPVGGSVLLGLLWGLWHVPLIVLGVYPITSLQLTAYVLVNVPAAAIIFTWVFNHVKGSLLIMMLLHTSINTTVYLLRGVFPGQESAVSSSFPLGMGINVLALALVIVTRGRLGNVGSFRDRLQAS